MEDSRITRVSDSELVEAESAEAVIKVSVPELSKSEGDESLDAKKRSVIIMDLVYFVGYLFAGGLFAGIFWTMATWFNTPGYWRRAAFTSLTFMVPAGLFVVIAIAMHGFYLLRHFIPHGNACV